MALVAGAFQYFGGLLGGQQTAATTATTTVMPPVAATAGQLGAVQTGINYVQLGQMQAQQQAQQVLQAFAQHQAAYDTHQASYEAKQRAMELLRSHMTLKQREESEKFAYFTVRGGYSGNLYVIQMHGHSFNISGECELHRPDGALFRILSTNPRVKVRICCGPDPITWTSNHSDYVWTPIGDVLLGQKLALECDELAFLSKANFSPG